MSGRWAWPMVLLACAALWVACEEDEPPPAQSATPLPSPYETLTAKPTAELDEHGCELGPDGEKCRFIATYTPEPTPTVSPRDASYPDGTRTGIPEVDAVIDAIERRDGQKLAQMALFSTYPCQENPPGNPQPMKCRPGQREGDPLVGIWFSHFEGGLWPFEADGDRDKLGAMIQRLLDDPGWGRRSLHAVYRFQAGDRNGFLRPAPEIGVVFTRWSRDGGPEYDTFVLAKGGLIALEIAFPPVDEPTWNNPAAPGWILPRAR